jgi:hypothetical protein
VLVSAKQMPKVRVAVSSLTERIKFDKSPIRNSPISVPCQIEREATKKKKEKKKKKKKRKKEINDDYNNQRELIKKPMKRILNFFFHFPFLSTPFIWLWSVLHTWVNTAASLR